MALAPALALPNVAPLARRVRAWWNGLELTGQTPGSSPRPCGAAPTKPNLPPLDGERKATLFTDPRIHLMERVWGVGFSGPGDAAWVANFVAPLALDGKMTVANLGAGLGGVARAIATASGTWVSGYDARPDFVQAGMELSKIAGAAKRAPILAYDPNALSLKHEGFNAVIATEAFHAVADKPALYGAVFDALRLNGHLLFTDYLAKRVDRASPAIQEWLKLEPGPVHLSTPDETKAALQAAQFDVRIVEDMNAEMRHLITVGWGRFAEALRQTSFDRRLGAALADELALWLARLRVIESGEVGVFRVHALKLKNKPKR